MAIYRVQAPDGSIVRMEAPDDATSEQLSQAVNAYAQAAQAPSTAEPKSESLIEKAGKLPGAIKEAITGEERSTPTTEALPEWLSMPEFRGAEGLKNFFSLPGFKTAVGTMFSNPEETAQIIQANYPDVQVRQDEKGNYILRSPTDGQEYAIKPGFTGSDIPRALGLLTAFGPAAEASTIRGMASGSAATQAAIEGTQAATGGNLDPGEVATAGVMGGVIPAAGRVVQAAKGPVVEALQKLRATPNPAQAVRDAAATAEGAGIAPAAVPEAVPAAVPEQAAPDASMPAADLAQTAKKAAEGGFGSNRATKVLAEQAAPDAKTVDAAKRLGIEDYLQPDHVTTNQAYRELAQAVKSIPGSDARAAEIKGLDQVAQRADKLIDEIGGTQDMSTLDASVKGRLQGTQQELEARANKLYEEVRKGVPATTPAPADSVLSFVKQRADELGGAANLSPMEKQILAKLSTKAGKQPTYALLDDVRKDLGAAAKQSGPFKDADIGLAKKLYSLLSNDQAAVVDSLGMSDTYNAARQAVAVRKGIEDDLAALFGKNLDKSLVPDLNGAVRALPTGDSAKLVRLLKSVPEDMRQEVVASGLNAAFGKTAKQGSISFSGFSKWYEGLLKNKQAYTAVMANLPPSSRKQLSDLYRVSKGVSAASKERITTGRIQAVMDELKPADNLAAKLYDTARKSAVGAAAGTVVTPILGPGAGAAIASALTKGAKPSSIKAVDQVISSPEFLNLTKQAGKPGEKAARLRLVHSKPFTRFVRAAGQPRELSDREKWILEAMQAENQQGASQ